MLLRHLALCPIYGYTIIQALSFTAPAPQDQITSIRNSRYSSTILLFTCWWFWFDIDAICWVYMISFLTRVDSYFPSSRGRFVPSHSQIEKVLFIPIPLSRTFCTQSLLKRKSTIYSDSYSWTFCTQSLSNRKSTFDSPFVDVCLEISH